MQKISVMASPGTDAFLKETMPRQYNVDPMDSPTLEFVEPGTDPRDYDHQEDQIDQNRKYASGLSKLVYEQNEIDSLQKFETPKIQIAHSKIGQAIQEKQRQHQSTTKKVYLKRSVRSQSGRPQSTQKDEAFTYKTQVSRNPSRQSMYTESQLKKRKSPTAKKSVSVLKKSDIEFSNLKSPKRSPFKKSQMKIESGAQTSRDFQFIKVTARVRPILHDERGMKKVLKVMRKDDDSNMYKLDQDIISLETGAHFNNGHKFFEFSSILDENDNQ